MFGSVCVYSSSDFADYYSLHLEKPDTCPFCKKTILPIELLGVYHEQNRDCHISAFFLCPGCEIFSPAYITLKILFQKAAILSEDHSS